MRVVAYISPVEDAQAVRDWLSSQRGVTGVGVRQGMRWEQGDRPETGWDAVHAPSFPQIIGAYATIGTPEIGEDLKPPPALPWEVPSISPADTVTIVCPGAFVKQELEQYAPKGVIIVVNEAVKLLPQASYWAANDGFVGHNSNFPFAGTRLCRKAHHPTLPPGAKWYDMDRVPVGTGMFTVRCALKFAHRTMKAKHIWLIGHDCQAGAGTGTEAWDTGLIERVRNEVQSDINALARDHNIEVDHVVWDKHHKAAKVEHYEPTATLRPKKGPTQEAILDAADKAMLRILSEQKAWAWMCSRPERWAVVGAGPSLKNLSASDLADAGTIIGCNDASNVLPEVDHPIVGMFHDAMPIVVVRPDVDALVLGCRNALLYEHPNMLFLPHILPLSPLGSPALGVWLARLAGAKHVHVLCCDSVLGDVASRYDEHGTTSWDYKHHPACTVALARGVELEWTCPGRTEPVRVPEPFRVQWVWPWPQGE